MVVRVAHLHEVRRAPEDGLELGQGQTPSLAQQVVRCPQRLQRLLGQIRPLRNARIGHGDAKCLPHQYNSVGPELGK